MRFYVYYDREPDSKTYKEYVVATMECANPFKSNDFSWDKDARTWRVGMVQIDDVLSGWLWSKSALAGLFRLGPEDLKDDILGIYDVVHTLDGETIVDRVRILHGDAFVNVELTTPTERVLATVNGTEGAVTEAHLQAALRHLLACEIKREKKA